MHAAAPAGRSTTTTPATAGAVASPKAGIKRATPLGGGATGYLGGSSTGIGQTHTRTLSSAQKTSHSTITATTTTTGGRSLKSTSSSSATLTAASLTSTGNTHRHQQLLTPATSTSASSEIEEISKKISEHADAIYRTWKSHGLAPTELLEFYNNTNNNTASATDTLKGTTTTTTAAAAGATTTSRSSSAAADFFASKVMGVSVGADVGGGSGEDAASLHNLVATFVSKDKEQQRKGGAAKGPKPSGSAASGANKAKTANAKTATTAATADTTTAIGLTAGGGGGPSPNAEATTKRTTATAGAANNKMAAKSAQNASTTSPSAKTTAATTTTTATAATTSITSKKNVKSSAAAAGTAKPSTAPSIASASALAKDVACENSPATKERKTLLLGSRQPRLADSDDDVDDEHSKLSKLLFKERAADERSRHTATPTATPTAITRPHALMNGKLSGGEQAPARPLGINFNLDLDLGLTSVVGGGRDHAPLAVAGRSHDFDLQKLDLNNLGQLQSANLKLIKDLLHDNEPASGAATPTLVAGKTAAAVKTNGASTKATTKNPLKVKAADNPNRRSLSPIRDGELMGAGAVPGASVTTVDGHALSSIGGGGGGKPKAAVGAAKRALNAASTPTISAASAAAAVDDVELAGVALTAALPHSGAAAPLMSSLSTPTPSSLVAKTATTTTPKSASAKNTTKSANKTIAKEKIVVDRKAASKAAAAAASAAVVAAEAAAAALVHALNDNNDAAATAAAVAAVVAAIGRPAGGNSNPTRSPPTAAAADSAPHSALRSSPAAAAAAASAAELSAPAAAAAAAAAASGAIANGNGHNTGGALVMEVARSGMPAPTKSTAASATKMGRSAAAAASAGGAPLSNGQEKYLARPILTRGSVAERVLMFEKCPDVRLSFLNIKRPDPAEAPPKSLTKVKLHATPPPPPEQNALQREIRSTKSVYIPRFYFPHGKPQPQIAQERTLRGILSAFDSFPNNQVTKDELPRILQLCGLPFYWRMPVMVFCQQANSGLVERQRFVEFWKQMNVYCHEAASRFVYILSRGQRFRSYILPEDLAPMVQDVVDTHPGLAFLKEATEFHSRYVHTVIARIFYAVNRSWSGRISIAELKKSDLIEIISMLEEEDDINQIMAFFSYEHFYVIYCKFWELDKDHDLLINQDDLARHSDHALSTRIVERIFSGCVTRNDNKKSPDEEPKMSYTDFVWFLLSEEDKRSPTAIEYWFRCMDIDGDGVLSMYELEYFYEEQQQRMESIGIETLPFEDCLCQMLDMIKPQQRDCITLGDLKRCKMTHVFFDTFFNLEKYLDHEQRDPFASQRDEYASDWDRFAAQEYELLITEEND